MTSLRASLFCAAAAMAACAVPASASTVSAIRGNADTNPIRTLLKIESRPGEKSTMRISWRYDRAGDVYALVVTDKTAPLRARGNLCRKATRRSVRCEGLPFTIEGDLGDRDDALRILKPRGDVLPEPGLSGGSGDDVLVAEIPARWEGGRGDDRLTNGDSKQRRQASLLGGPGRDILRSGNSGDYIQGGPGNDVLYGGRGADKMFGGTIYQKTSSGNDRLYAGPGSDELEDGDSGNKIGPDLLVGGRGNDRVNSYAERSKPVFVNLSDTAGDGERGENDALVGVENIRGGGGNDRLIGDGDANRLNGYIGKDFIRGRGGRDFLVDYGGDDRMRGDLGDDVFSTPPEGVAGVDCGSGSDRITMGFREEGRTGPTAGPLVPNGCEWITGRNFREAVTSSTHPVRTSSGGVLTFALTHFECCEYAFLLTRTSAPFDEYDSAPIDSERVSLDGPSRPNILRASIRHSDGRSIAWRFDADR